MTWQIAERIQSGVLGHREFLSMSLYCSDVESRVIDKAE